MVDRLPERLRAKVSVCFFSRCWVWKGKWNSGNGYGKIRHQGRCWMVHRLVYTLLVGEIPDGLVFDHKCRNRKCCICDHLEPVTVRENTHRGEAVLFSSEREDSHA